MKEFLYLQNALGLPHPCGIVLYCVTLRSDPSPFSMPCTNKHLSAEYDSAFFSSQGGGNAQKNVMFKIQNFDIPLQRRCVIKTTTIVLLDQIKDASSPASFSLVPLGYTGKATPLIVLLKCR